MQPGKKYARALTIAGSDSGGGAGIQADLKTFTALQCYGSSVLTALTAQNTLAVSAIHSVPEDFIRAQCEAVLADIGADAIKLGMLHRVEVIETVRDCLAHYSDIPVVLDPVMIAQSGATLLADDAIQALKQLSSLVKCLTPNVPEAELLLPGEAITDEASQFAKAQGIVEMYQCSVLLKGGHLSGETCADCFIDHASGDVHWLRHQRLSTHNTHGTGCTYSAAIAAYLAKGHSILQSVKQAHDYLFTALQRGSDYTLGQGHGPVCHFT